MASQDERSMSPPEYSVSLMSTIKPSGGRDPQALAAAIAILRTLEDSLCFVGPNAPLRLTPTTEPPPSPSERVQLKISTLVIPDPSSQTWCITCNLLVPSSNHSASLAI